MREILFRGKRVDNGEWVEGLLWKKKYNHNKIFISYFPDEDDYEETVVVSPETVGQYTGLKDKNGKKIFEGDTIICFNRKFACEWNKVSCQFTLKNLDENFGFNYFCSAEVEVIGSLHDTELLGGDKE